MADLLMPSDVKRARGAGGAAPPGEPSPDAALIASAPTVEPPSLKLIVRLFLIPLLIVGAAVGVMYVIGLMAGGTPSTEEILARLRHSGGGRTADVLVGPGAKQRYLDAKALVDTMKRPEGMASAERVQLSDSLIEILAKHTKDDEGEVRHFLLLALGRTWQLPPGAKADETPDVSGARQRAVDALLSYADADQVDVRKAAIGALGFIGRQEASRRAVPMLVRRLSDPQENFDVRLVAASMLGPVATAEDREAIAALEQAMRDADPRNAELVWASALSLAQLGQDQVADTILMLLDRDELAQLKYYDRESDPQNPSFRPLSDQEQQRFLINTMLGAKDLNVPAVQQRLADLRDHDPSPRVRAAAMEILQGSGAAAAG